MGDQLTVTVYNENNEAVFAVYTGSASDSMSSFVARSGLDHHIYKAIIQLGSAAYSYFHNGAQAS